MLQNPYFIVMSIGLFFLGAILLIFVLYHIVVVERQPSRSDEVEAAIQARGRAIVKATRARLATLPAWASELARRIKSIKK